MFADAGLSPAEISSLFIIWSATSFVVEVPSGALADILSRRALLTAGPLLSGAGYALWTFAPSYPAFAVGFVLWGTQSALRSGAYEALVYDNLTTLQASDRYATIIGRTRAVSTVAVLASYALAAPVLAAGGYVAAGIASVSACILMAAVGASLPEAGHERHDDGGGWSAYVATLASGLREVRGRPRVRRAVLLSAALVGFSALDEYLSLLAIEIVSTPASVALLVAVVAVGSVLGAAYAGRAARWPIRRLGAAVILAAIGLALGAGSGHIGGFVVLAGVFAVLEISYVVTDARLQDSITGPARATITSVAGFGAEVLAIMVYATYAAGSALASPGLLLAIFAVPLLVIGLGLVLN